MPSKDTYHRENPGANEWMAREGLIDPEKQLESAPAASGRAGSRTERRAMSAQVQRLARRLGSDPDELAQKLSPDTLRRTKYPVLEIVNEDGTRTFKHDPGIEQGRTALIRK